MLNSNKALHRELPGGANLQLFHCTKYISLNSYPNVTALQVQIYSPFQTSKTAPGPMSAFDSCWFVISPLPPHPNHHLKISITQPTPSTPSLCLSTSIVEGCAYSGQNQQPYSLSLNFTHQQLQQQYATPISPSPSFVFYFLPFPFKIIFDTIFAALILTNL